jgi:hypothetical protein
MDPEHDKVSGSCKVGDFRTPQPHKSGTGRNGPVEKDLHCLFKSHGVTIPHGSRFQKQKHPAPTSPETGESALRPIPRRGLLLEMDGGEGGKDDQDMGGDKQALNEGIHGGSPL